MCCCCCCWWWWWCFNVSKHAHTGISHASVFCTCTPALHLPSLPPSSPWFDCGYVDFVLCSDLYSTEYTNNNNQPTPQGGGGGPHGRRGGADARRCGRAAGGGGRVRGGACLSVIYSCDCPLLYMPTRSHALCMYGCMDVGRVGSMIIISSLNLPPSPMPPSSSGRSLYLVCVCMDMIISSLLTSTQQQQRRPAAAPGGGGGQRGAFGGG